MLVRHLPAYEYRRMRWKNNLGWTREIHAGSAASPDVDAGDDWDWRVSIAEIDHDCGFSAFPAHDRILVLLSGNGMRLDFEDGRRVPLDPPRARIAFRGEDAPACALHDGPTRDFNLMWKRDRARAELMHRPLVGPMLFFREPGVQWLVHLVGGRARVKDRPDIAPMEAGDSLLMASHDASGARVILDGGGELLLARVQSIGA